MKNLKKFEKEKGLKYHQAFQEWSSRINQLVELEGFVGYEFQMAALKFNRFEEVVDYFRKKFKTKGDIIDKFREDTANLKKERFEFLVNSTKDSTLWNEYATYQMMKLIDMSMLISHAECTSQSTYRYHEYVNRIMFRLEQKEMMEDLQNVTK